jgi:hypothetical protein
MTFLLTWGSDAALISGFDLLAQVAPRGATRESGASHVFVFRGGCVASALPKVWFCLRCKFEHDVRIYDTSGTSLEVLSKGSFVVLCLWLRLLPPWKGF